MTDIETHKRLVYNKFNKYLIFFILTNKREPFGFRIFLRSL